MSFGGGTNRDATGASTGGYDVLGTGVVGDPTRGGTQNFGGRTLQDISAGSSDDAAYVAAIQANVDAQIAQQEAARAAQSQAAAQASQRQLLEQQLAGVYPDAILRGLRQNIGIVRPSAASFAPLSFPQGARMGRSYLGLTTDMMGSSGVRGIGKIPKAPVYDPVTDTYSVDGQPIDRQTAEYMMEVRGDVYDAMPSPSEGMFGKVMDYGLLGKAHEMLLGQTAKERAMGDYGQLLSMGGEINSETGDVIAPTARGELKYSNTTGLVTYKGAPDPTYEGAYKNLINPYVSDDDSGTVEPEATTVAAVEPEPEVSMIEQGYRYPAGGYYPQEGRFLRRGLLDIAPMTYGGLLRDYSPMTFEEMNVGFRQPTDVSLYQDPYDVSGYALI